jgi:uncharacterized protein (TIGR02996 family)
MTHEDAFIQAILESPDDDGLRLIYADWLQERDDPRGELLRVATELEALERREPPPDVRGRLARVRRIADLHCRWRGVLPLVDRNWFAILHRGELRCGEVRRDGACPGRWDRLPPGPDSPCARYCQACRRWAWLCWSASEVERAVRWWQVAAPVVVLSPT